MIVLLRCSMLSISQRALRTLLLRNSRVCLSPFFSLRNFRHIPLMYRLGAGSLVISISYLSVSSSYQMIASGMIAWASSPPTSLPGWGCSVASLRTAILIASMLRPSFLLICG